MNFRIRNKDNIQYFVTKKHLETDIEQKFYFFIHREKYLELYTKTLGPGLPPPPFARRFHR